MLTYTTKVQPYSYMKKQLKHHLKSEEKFYYTKEKKSNK